MGSKHPLTVVPAVAPTKNGFDPLRIEAWIELSKAFGFILPLLSTSTLIILFVPIPSWFADLTIE